MRVAMSNSIQVNPYDAQEFCNGLQDSVRTAIKAVETDLNTALRSGQTLQDKAANLRLFSAQYHGKRVPVRLTVNDNPITSMETVADYIQQRIAENISGDALRSIVERRFQALVNISTGLPAHAILNAIESGLLFKDQVAAKKPWDYKLHILKAFRAWSFDLEYRTLYNYDIWGNLHYGLIGLASLFTADELFLGAAGAQVKDNGWKWVLQHGFVDDERDHEAIRVGIDLWTTLERAPSTDEIMEAVRNASPRLNTFRCGYR